jgi:adenosylcobinamide-phosphate synthase
MAKRRSIGLEPGTLVWGVAWDILLGDLPEEVDSRALAARASDALERSAPRNSRAARSVYGATSAIMLPYVAWTGTKLLLAATGRVHRQLYSEIATVLFKGSLAVRGTADALREAEETAHGKAKGEWRTQADASTRLTGEGGPPPPSEPSSSITTEDEARTVSRALSRLASDFQANVVGPLFYFALFGVPGAVAYQSIRTLGQRWGRLAEDPLSGAARRMEMAVSFIPSLLGGVLMTGAAQALEERGQDAWQTAREEASGRTRTEGGWTEGAIAGALNVRIETPDGSDVNPDGERPTIDDLPRARRLFWAATAGAVGGSLVLATLRSAARRGR